MIGNILLYYQLFTRGLRSNIGVINEVAIHVLEAQSSHEVGLVILVGEFAKGPVEHDRVEQTEDGLFHLARLQRHLKHLGAGVHLGTGTGTGTGAGANQK